MAKRNILAAVLAASCFFPIGSAKALSPSPDDEPMTPGRFEPSWDSLKQHEAPQWFRDAKFGIWAHWDAQCVPECGDWYARWLYGVQPLLDKWEIRGATKDYAYQIAHYGHPSKIGFKDIDRLWKAEHWDPDALIALYKQAGAQYFVALANHSDNFDCFDSKYQPWNSVNIGPKKDIVGIWEQAARKAGLRFGVTVHSARSWSWFETSQGSDSSGPLKGVPYDGNLSKLDGIGQWWEGYDPQDLYAQHHAIGAPPDQHYADKFYNRTIDLVNHYHPDLLYFDDGVLPLREIGEQFGLQIAAHYYNANSKWHGGTCDAVMTTKGLNPDQRQCLCWDVERGVADAIEQSPWQCDSCIGQWHYSRDVFEKHYYKSADRVIHMLSDIVSKNGNLLLNVPLRGDGTIDSDEKKFLHGMADWMKVNGQAIFGTRPWIVYGEGPSTLPKPAGEANFNEDEQQYSSQDVRFTTKDGVLYAIVLGWPKDLKTTIASLGTASANAFGKVAAVELLGCDKPIHFEQTPAALTVDFPKDKPCESAYVLKIMHASSPAIDTKPTK